MSNEETVGSFYWKNLQNRCNPSKCFVSYRNLLFPVLPKQKRKEVINVLRNSDGTYTLQTMSIVHWPSEYGEKRRLTVTSGARYKTCLMLCYSEDVDPETLIGLN